MSFLSANELIKDLKTSKLNIAKKRDKMEIPFFKRGRKFYHLAKYEDIINMRNKIRNKPCNVISFGNNKGGVAKTTTVINIASSLAFYGFKVLMIDMDMQSNLSRHFKVNETGNNIVTAINTGNIEKAVNSLNHDYYAYGSLDLIPNDLSLMKEYNNFDYSKLQKVIDTLSNDYDFILLDTPPNLADITPQCLKVSNFAFMILKPDSYSTTGAINFLDLIEKSNSKLLGGVITKNHTRYLTDLTSSDEIDSIFKEFDNQICNTKISYSNIFNEIPLMKEHSALTYQPNHKCTTEYFDVSDYILNSILRDS